MRLPPLQKQPSIGVSEATPPFHVLTGGPGAGKTTLIEALACAGFTCVPEAGRAVIGEQEASGGCALPSVDPLAFAEAMLARDIAAFDANRAATGPVFFDRGIPDVAGYLRLEGLPVPDDLLSEARTRRYAGIFICPPWPDIYVTDKERKQTAELAVRTYDAMVETYTELGYALVEVPRAPVAERVRFILTAVGR
jgi:predicted ATPase